MGKLRAHLKDVKAMTLIEVLIAVFIFSIFILAFISAQGNNINTSIRFKEELKLRDIAEIIINEQLINPPEVKVSSGKVKVKNISELKYKKFEEDEAYEYSIETYKISIPDFDKIIGSNEQSQEEKQKQSTQKLIYEKFKDNMENLVYQMSVTIRHIPSQKTFTLSSWFYVEGEVKLGF